MDFELSEDHRVLQESVQDFAENEVAPGAADRDRDAEFPDELRDKLAEMGFFGIAIPEAYSGAGMDTLASCIVVEEIGKACGATGVIISAHNSLCVDPIMAFGTEEQKKKYLPKLATGEAIGCLSLTEPGAGSDAGSVQCKAELKDDGWHINGTKCFITNGKQAGVTVLIARTEPESERNRLSAFIVEKPTPGLEVTKLEKKLGIKSSSTAEYVFEDCVIPKENLLGQRGKGLGVALATLDGGRLGIASQALGIAEACLEAAAKYAQTREQFKQPIANFQAIQNKLADIAVLVEAAKLLTYRGAWQKDQGRDYGHAAAMAKLFASEASSVAANHAVQVFGGYGYCNDYPVERYLRDAKITELYEGTSEIHRLVITRGLRKNPQYITEG